MNNVGGLLFIGVGVLFGYWVVTGRATNFFNAISGNPGQNTGATPPPNTNPPPSYTSVQAADAAASAILGGTPAPQPGPSPSPPPSNPNVTGIGSNSSMAGMYR